MRASISAAPIAIRGGKIAVEDIIGHDEGIVVRSSVNEPFLVFRPSLPQLIPNLPRTRASDLSEGHRANFNLGRSLSRAPGWSRPASAPAR